MSAPLAYVQRTDSTNANFQIVLVCVGLVVAAGVLAFVPIALARRRPSKTDGINAMAVLWAIAAIGVTAYAAYARYHWSEEQNLRISTGYFDPNDTADAPAWPWAAWAALIAAYVGVVAWAAIGARPRAE